MGGRVEHILQKTRHCKLYFFFIFRKSGRKFICPFFLDFTKECKVSWGKWNGVAAVVIVVVVSSSWSRSAASEGWRRWRSCWCCWSFPCTSACACSTSPSQWPTFSMSAKNVEEGDVKLTLRHIALTLNVTSFIMDNSKNAVKTTDKWKQKLCRWQLLSCGHKEIINVWRHTILVNIWPPPPPSSFLVLCSLSKAMTSLFDDPNGF